MNIIRKIQKHLFPKTLKCVYRKDILEYALHHNHDTGVCNAIWCSLSHYGLVRNIEKYLPLENMDNAKKFKAKYRCDRYWWPLNDWTDRIKYIKWLLEQYKDDITNLKEL